MDDECNRDTCKHRKNEIYANCFCSLQESFSSGEDDGGCAKFDVPISILAFAIVIARRNGDDFVDNGVAPQFYLVEGV